jgi:hypothetical protein
MVHGRRARFRQCSASHDYRGEEGLAGCEGVWACGAEELNCGRWYVDQNNDVTQVCEGTNKKDDLAYTMRGSGELGILTGRLRCFGLRMRR